MLDIHIITVDELRQLGKAPAAQLLRGGKAQDLPETALGPGRHACVKGMVLYDSI